MNAELIVQTQLDFYNKHDVEGFLSTYTDDAQLFLWGNPIANFSGKSQMRTRYTEGFKNPKLHAVIKNRMVKGNIVIDEEHVTGITDTLVVAIAIYEIEGDKIKKVTFIK